MASTSLAVPLIPSTLSDTYSLPQLPCLLCLPTYLQIRKTSLFRLTLFLPSVILGPWQFNRQAFLFHLSDFCFWRGDREEAMLLEFWQCLLLLTATGAFPQNFWLPGGKGKEQQIGRYAPTIPSPVNTLSQYPISYSNCNTHCTMSSKCTVADHW